MAEELYKIQSIKEKIVRTYSSQKEDIFNVVFKDLKEYSILHKMIFDERKQVKTEAVGFDATSISKLSKSQFNKFLKYKAKIEKKILKDYPIIVTTTGNAASKAIRDLGIKRVVIDEAT